jgi:hypothetical protein
MRPTCWAWSGNADVIEMACYAPLLVNVNPGARQWSTNLIGYDALTSFGSTSYYMQKMFAENKGDIVLPTTLTPANALPVTGRPTERRGRGRGPGGRRPSSRMPESRGAGRPGRPLRLGLHQTDHGLEV